ncbi:MAG: hypothetical protein WCO56_12170 [Verrucomicrobiota bacterium]
MASVFGSSSTCAQVIEELPFEYREGLIWVQVQADKPTGTLNFLLDSGAEVTPHTIRWR